MDNNGSHPLFRLDGLQKSLSVSLQTGFLLSGFLRKTALLSEQHKNWHVLDFGCGEGGLTASLSADGFRLTCVEINEKLVPQVEYWQKEYQLPFTIIPYSRFMGSTDVPQYDFCVLRDVLEHIEDMGAFHKVLGSSRRIFLTTPNKYSLLLLPRDPHNGLPFVSLLGREQVLRLNKIRGKGAGRGFDPGANYRNVGLYSTFHIKKMLMSHGYVKIENYSRSYYRFRQDRAWLYRLSALLPRQFFDSFIAPEIVIYAEKEKTDENSAA